MNSEPIKIDARPAATEITEFKTSPLGYSVFFLGVLLQKLGSTLVLWGYNRRHRKCCGGTTADKIPLF
jgi:hypothetical protein